MSEPRMYCSYVIYHQINSSFKDVIAIIMAWWIIFTIVATLLLCFGFGPKGIIAGVQFIITALGIAIDSYSR
jgi:hypothetical protein